MFYVILENSRRQRVTLEVKATSEENAIHVAEWRGREEQDDISYHAVDVWPSLIIHRDQEATQ